MVDIIIILQDASGLLIWPVCVVALILILLQGGAGDISSAFGGGGQLDSSLGVGAQQKISKVTGWFVTIFLVLVVILSIPIKGELGAGEQTDPTRLEKKSDMEDEAVPVIDDSADDNADAGADTSAVPPDAGDADKNNEQADVQAADGGADIQPVEVAPQVQPDKPAEDNADAGNADDAGGADIKPIE